MKTRTRRRPSTRSADQEAIVCPTASKIKPSASRLIAMMESRALPAGRDPHAIDEAERGHRRPDQAVPPAQLEGIVEQRAREQPEHHDIAGRQRDQRRMRDRDRRGRADRRGDGMRRRAQRKRDRQPPGDARCENRETAKRPAPAAAPRWRRASARSRCKTAIHQLLDLGHPRALWRVTHNSDGMAESTSSRLPDARRAAAPRLATPMFSRSMQWMILSSSNVANDQSIDARAASTA